MERPRATPPIPLAVMIVARDSVRDEVPRSRNENMKRIAASKSVFFLPNLLRR